MKIDNYTLTVLKNFAKINPSIEIKEGNTIRTFEPSSKAIFADATVDTIFEKQFAIYNLDRFLSVLSMFNDPELTFNDKSVIISGDGKKTEYLYTDSINIKKPSDKKINMPSIDIEFKLKLDDMKNIDKAASILSLPNVVVFGDGKEMFLMAEDSENPTTDTHSISLGEIDKEFKVVFKKENLRMLPSDYNVSISSKGISRFESEDDKLTYYIAVEAKYSNF